jgi:NAD(P)-dependent dehydrogenase (short-subunit alcohol dehydrogenase family)
MKIAGCSALVTGGASGLGAATARMLASLGAQVTVFDKDDKRGSELAAELGSPGAFIAGDIRDPYHVMRTLDEVDERQAGLQICVNAAGIAPAFPILHKTVPDVLAEFVRVIDINLIGTFDVIRQAAAIMAKGEPNEDGERGVIVNTASIAAYDGQIGQAAYSASKGAIVAMTLPIARELARHGIRVVTIAPGLFDTPLLNSIVSDKRKELERQVPFPKRLGRPSEYASLAIHAIQNVMLNGEVIRLDGAIRMATNSNA